MPSSNHWPSNLKHEALFNNKEELLVLVIGESRFIKCSQTYQRSLCFKVIDPLITSIHITFSHPLPVPFLKSCFISNLKCLTASFQ